MIQDKNKKIEEILGSLDNIGKAAVPDFFYTRLKAKMESLQEQKAVPARRSLVLRPVFALTALAAILVINAFVLLQRNSSAETNPTDVESFQSIAAEYSLNDNNAILFDINQEK